MPWLSSTKKLHLFRAISYCRLQPVWLSHIFPHYLKNGMILEKEFIKHKMFILIFSTNFVWKISPNTFSLCSSLNARGQVSVTQNNNRQNYSSVILIFIFLDSKQEDKRFWIKLQQAFFSSWMQFWLVIVVPRYLNLVNNNNLRISSFLKSSTTPSNHRSLGIPTLPFLWVCNPCSSGCLIILHSL